MMNELTDIIAFYQTRYRGEGINWNQWIADQDSRINIQQPIEIRSPLQSTEIREVLDALREPSYQEVTTTCFIADVMLSLGYTLKPTGSEVKQHETELVFVGSETPKVFFRVDLDAVSIGNGQYQHCCGHSVNMSSILTTAQELKEEGIDDIGFIFQPAEEGPGNDHDNYVHPKGFGGGQYLRNKGVYADLPRVVSCHIDTSLADDQLRITAGEATAAAHRFTYTAEGIPAHAALPWQGKNPVEGVNNFLISLYTLNDTFKELGEGQYGLLTPSQINTKACELNSLSEEAVIRGISRISGLIALQMFQDFATQYNLHIELEAPPVINDQGLASLAQEVANENGFTYRSDPARFRDETAWAGPFQQPWVDQPERYGRGCDRILHFFTPNYNKESGGLHSTSFHPNYEKAIDAQVKMITGLARRLKI